jgi:gliding motility-associated-like protein
MTDKTCFYRYIKKLLISFSLVLSSILGFSQTTSIPDSNFEQALIDLGFDSGPIDGLILTSNLIGITNLDVNAKNITDLTGIEDFKALEILNCIDNQLTNLNVVQNLNLTQLYCSNNKLTNLNTSQNTTLDILWCSDNQLINLDVTKNIDLISLICDNNQLTKLDVTKNINLTVFKCINNQLTNLDVTKNIAMNRFFCDYNFLTSIDVSKNVALIWFYCGDNMITSLDVSNNTQLEWFWCVRNQLSDLDVTKNKELVHLIFGANQISKIDLTQNSKLLRVWAAKNLLNSIDTSKNSVLEQLLCDINNITEIDVSNNPALINLSCSSNLLCSLNVKNGNNTNFIRFISKSNPNLSCIFVDDISYSTSNWTDIDATSNFVSTEIDCDAFRPLKPLVDSFSDVIENTSYILPNISNGNYFTEPNGNGTQLNIGDTLSNSQTIYIYAETFCESNESSFNVIISEKDIYIPKFFTPNNDSNHDYWKVIDNANSIKSIYIYNRYGKLLKSLGPNSEGWDGTLNGSHLLTDDYWFMITLNTGKNLKGHFTLKR